MSKQELENLEVEDLTLLLTGIRLVNYLGGVLSVGTVNVQQVDEEKAAGDWQNRLARMERELIELTKLSNELEPPLPKELGFLLDWVNQVVDHAEEMSNTMKMVFQAGMN